MASWKSTSCQTHDDVIGPVEKPTRTPNVEPDITEVDDHEFSAEEERSGIDSQSPTRG